MIMGSHVDYIIAMLIFRQDLPPCTLKLIILTLGLRFTQAYVFCLISKLVVITIIFEFICSDCASYYRKKKSVRFTLFLSVLIPTLELFAEGLNSVTREQRS